LTTAARIRSALRPIGWYFTSLMGDDAYAKYRSHHESVHGDDPGGVALMTEREFWRDQTDRQDRNPQGRCC
jgi:uncharacterized short protein YbdD (DUF466 family)